jgi:hypothetical protein
MEIKTMLEISEFMISTLGAFIIAERFLLMKKINSALDKYLGKGKVFKDKQTKYYNGRRRKK